MVRARLLTNCSGTLRDIHTNARENITRTRAKPKAGYFFVAHPVFPYLYHTCRRGESRHLLVILSFLLLVDGHFVDSEWHFNELYYYYYFFCGAATQRGSWPPHS